MDEEPLVVVHGRKNQNAKNWFNEEKGILPLDYLGTFGWPNIYIVGLPT